MKFVIFGLTISSSWGNGHATLWRGLCGALVLKIPPETLARLPFEVEPLVKVAWLVGLLPTLPQYAGLKRALANTSACCKN